MSAIHKAPPTTSEDAWCRPGRFAIWLALLVAAAYPAVLVGRESFFFRDFVQLVYPAAHYHRECFWRGEIPLWNPLSNCGIPFLAQWYVLALYPGSLIYLLLPMPWSVNLFLLAHLYFGGMGAYFLARRWTGNSFAGAVAGVGFAFSGLATSSLMWTSYSAALSWIPWLLLLTERAWREGGRAMVWAVLAGAMMMLCGVPEITLFTWLIIAAAFIGQWTGGILPRARSLGRATAMVGLIAGLTAVQILPFLELLANSQRTAAFGSNQWAMPPTGWLNFLVPLFRTAPWNYGIHFQFDQFAVTSYYAGIGILALALVAVIRCREPRVWFLGGVTLVCLVLALGDAGFVFGWLRRVLPQLGFMRFPVKMIFPLLVTLPVLAAFGVAHLQTATAKGQKNEWRWLAGIGGALWLGIVATLWFARCYPAYPPPYDYWIATWQNGLSRAALLAVLVGACAFACLAARGSRSAMLAGGFVLALLWLDGTTQGPQMNPGVAPYVYTPDISELAPPPKLGQGRVLVHPRAEVSFHEQKINDPSKDVLFKRRGLYSNLNLLDDVAKTHGIYSLFLGRPEELTARIFAAGDPGLPRLADFMGVTHSSSPTNPFVWSPRPTARPLVTSGQRVTFLPADQIVNRLAEPDFAPAEVVYLPQSDAARVGAFEHQPAARVSEVKFGAHRVEFLVESPGPTLAVIAQSHFPAWHATVNGQPADVLRANHAFQAVTVNAGKSRVVLKYVDRRFQTGAAISLTSLLIFAALWWRTRVILTNPLNG